MRIVLDILRFREDYLPSEDRYEYSIVSVLGGEYINISVSEEQLQAAVAEYADLIGQEEQPVYSHTRTVGELSEEAIQVQDENSFDPTSDEYQALGEHVTPPGSVVVKPPYRGDLKIQGAKVVHLGQQEHPGGPIEHPVDPVELEAHISALTDQLEAMYEAEAEAGLSKGYQAPYEPEEELYEEGEVMKAPHLFQDSGGDTYAGEGAMSELVEDLLGESEAPLVDEVTIGATADDLPDDLHHGEGNQVFGPPPGLAAEPPPPRRDITPGHVSRAQAIKQRIADRKKPNAHTAKFEAMRARAKQHPMRNGGGSDEAGNPLVTQRARQAVATRPPQRMPGPHQPTIRHTPATEPTVEDEDGFPSA